jgi:methionyl aminopeptidase
VIPIKTKAEIKKMREGGRRLAWVMDKLLKQTKLGVRLIELDQLAEALIEKQKGKPSFKMVRNYHWTTCLNINQGVVHGIPNNYRIRTNDVVSVDVGMFYHGFHTDMARTIRVQGSGFRVQGNNFLKAGREALEKAIKAARAGNRLGHVSQAIEKEIRKFGLSPVKVLTGHGVGKKLHEEPQIPCYLEQKIEVTPKLVSGMTLAIEVIYTRGRPDIVLEPDGWTVKTADDSLAGLFENTVVVTDGGGEILTQFN